MELQEDQSRSSCWRAGMIEAYCAAIGVSAMYGKAISKHILIG
jgi:hypothetical protein